MDADLAEHRPGRRDTLNAVVTRRRPPVSDSGLGLAAAIEGLREALTSAMNEGAAKRMQFEIKPIELSLQVAATNAGEGKVGWKILEAGVSHESTTTQTLKLTLTPVWKKDDGTLVRDFTIADIQPGPPGHVGPKPEGETH